MKKNVFTDFGWVQKIRNASEIINYLFDPKPKRPPMFFSALHVLIRPDVFNR